MKPREKTAWLVGAVGILLLGSVGATMAADVNWNVPGPAPWNVQENWSNDFVPEAGFDDVAVIANGGTAVVPGPVPSVLGLRITAGTVDIPQGGTLTVDDNTNIAGNGTLRLSGNGKLETSDLSSSGTIELNGKNANLRVANDFSNGTLKFDISNDGNAVIAVGGSALLNGNIVAAFANDVDVAFGSSWEFLSGASEVSGNARVIAAEGSAALPSGLNLQLATAGGKASITVGNLPVLALDRATGSARIQNVVGGPVTVTGYSIGSASGLLNPTSWNSLADQQLGGWTEANPRDQRLAELNLSSESTLEVGSSLFLGNAYNAALGAHPNNEDVTFEFATPDDRVLSGLVEYTGPANDLVLRVDPDTGDGAIQNLSRFTDPFDITVYSIFSESGALSVVGWTSLEDAGSEGWAEANPRADAIAELNLTGSQVFDSGKTISLGKPFTPGSTRDLVFEFGTVDGQLRFGTVEYGELGPIDLPGDCNGDGAVNAADLACVATIPDRDIVLGVLNTLPGDLDGNGDVAFPDFLVLSANFGDPTKTSYTEGNVDLMNGVAFPDFLVLSANFGQTPAAGATAAAVPEPCGLVLFSLGAFCLLGCHRQRIR